MVFYSAVGCGRKGDPLPPEKRPQSLGRFHTHEQGHHFIAASLSR